MGRKILIRIEKGRIQDADLVSSRGNRLGLPATTLIPTSQSFAYGEIMDCIPLREIMPFKHRMWSGAGVWKLGTVTVGALMRTSLGLHN